MKRATIFAFLMAVVSIAAPAALDAQTPNVSSTADRFLISARAGGVSLVEGSVSITRVNGTAGMLLKRDNVAVGDEVSTGADGRAEILLNPGSYLRLSRNSSFEFGATDLEDLKIKLNSGTAIFEVFAADEFRVSVFTPKGKVALIESGIYRVDVSADGSAVASVTKGKAEIGEENAVVLKEGRVGTLGSGQVAINKFDKDKQDEFALWSRSRSKELTKNNALLQDRSLDYALANGFRTGIWNQRSSFGLWILDYRTGGYCFLPYGYNWRSPYGGWYGNTIYPIYVPLGPVRTKGTRSVRGTNNGSVGNGVSTPDAAPSDRVTKGSRSTRSASSDAPAYTRVNPGTKRSVFDDSFPTTKGFDNSFPSSRSTSAPAVERGSFPSSPGAVRGVKTDQ